MDFEQIIKISKTSLPVKKILPTSTKKPTCSIAVALDNSFNFYYASNLESLRREGAKIIFFSPISDSKIPTCNGLYIGGGFPEILSQSLTKNTTMRKKIKQLAENDVPLYAECGGLMYLTKSIHDGKKKLPMIGFIDADTIMTKKMKLNYTKANILSNCIISNKSNVFHGHEFHYSELDSISKDIKFAYHMVVGDGITQKKDGIIQNNTLASYGHLFFDSKQFAKKFVDSCNLYSKK